MIAAVYLRQSIDATGEGLAVARQREDCLTLCRSKGWEPVEYVDNDTSASKGRRPEYERLLADIEGGRIGAVVSWDLDRLHRQPRELEHFIDLAEWHKIALATVGGEADLSTDNGRLFARIKGAVARAEVERKAARQRRANDQRAATGAPSKSSIRRFGFEADGITHRRAEARELRKMYADVLAGKSQRSIAGDLNSRGVLTTRGGQWNQSAVRAMLMRPHNAGLLRHRGEILGRGAWRPIVSEESYRAALALVTDPERQRSGAMPRRLLTQVARCGVCGEFVHSTGSGGVRQYVCRTGAHVSRRAEPLEAFISGLVCERMSRPDAVELLTIEAPDTSEARAEVDVMRRRLDSLAVEFADGTLTASQLRTATERLRSRIATAETALAKAGQSQALSPLAGAHDVRKVWARMPVERQRGAIDALMAVTLVKWHPVRSFAPESVRIEWRHG